MPENFNADFYSSILQPNGAGQRHRSNRRPVAGSNASWIVSEVNANAQRQQQQNLSVESIHVNPRQSAHAETEIGASGALREFQFVQESGIRTLRQSEDVLNELLMEDEADQDSGRSVDPRVLRFEVNQLNSQLPLQLQSLRTLDPSEQRSATANLLRSSINITQATNRNTNQQSPSSNGNSVLRNKIVYALKCNYCSQSVCDRAMRAILLADTKIELYSTDIPPKQLRLMDEDRPTQGCNCKIRDTLCSCCGNVLGYHVSQPCDRCLDARNNGHFWMFYSEGVKPAERKDIDGVSPLFWAALTPMCEFTPASSYARPCQSSNLDFSSYETFCR